MKNKNHLPLYGVGPVCVFFMIIFLIITVLLRHFGYLESGEVQNFHLLFRIIGIALSAIGIFIWIKAVIIEKIDEGIKDNHLITTGIYAWTRNPIYFAIAICLTGVGLLFTNFWFFLLPFFFWLDITLFMIFSEEKWLRNLYGKEYEEYCKRVNRCIPWFPQKK